MEEEAVKNDKPEAGSENSNKRQVVEEAVKNDEDDLWQDDVDMDIVHLVPDRRGRLVVRTERPMSDYERIREASIREREAKWGKRLEELRQGLNALVESNDKKKRGEDKKEKRPKKKPRTESGNSGEVRRRSSRTRNQPPKNYCEDRDWLTGDEEEENQAKARKSRSRQRGAVGRKSRSPGPHRIGELQRQQGIPSSSINGRAVGDEPGYERGEIDNVGPTDGMKLRPANLL